MKKLLKIMLLAVVLVVPCALTRQQANVYNGEIESTKCALCEADRLSSQTVNSTNEKTIEVPSKEDTSNNFVSCKKRQ